MNNAADWFASQEQKERVKKTRPLVIAVDFDGTLCESKWPEIGEPNYGMLAYCIAQRATGSKLILWTCRSGDMLQQAIDWCAGHHLEFDAINDNLHESKAHFGGDTRKVWADVYIDDKSANLEEVDRIGLKILFEHLSNDRGYNEDET